MTGITLHILPLQNLQSTDRSVVSEVSKVIGAAFGPEGPGLLLINGLRESFAEERLQLFSAARALAGLETEKLEALEFPNLHYSVGWSRGRESFKGIVDTNKGSFYGNPVFDDPSHGDSELSKKYLHYMNPNCWPSDQSCSSLKPLFRSLGQYINDIGIQLAKHCDDYIKQNLGQGVTFQSIEQTLRDSRAAKGRLLHYYPLDASTITHDTSEKMWCGYHNDHGTLTGLLSGAYFQEGQETPLTNVSDESAGLYVARGEGNVPEKVVFPADCLGFQLGESAQIASGGILKATPHAVRPLLNPQAVSRVTLAVFLQPNPWDTLRIPNAPQRSRKEILGTNKLVPALSNRYHLDDNFNDFAERTVQSYCQ